MIDELIHKSKAPISKRNHIGIEIECLVSLPNKNKLEKLIVNNNLQWNVQLGSDGSLKDLNFIPRYEMRRDLFNSFPSQVCINESEQKRGVELRLLAEERDAPEIINKLCSILNQCEVVINNTCGLHVHLDMRNRNHDLVYNNLYMFQMPMLNTQPKHRHHNKYCKKLGRILHDPTSRYYTINKRAYKEHRTLEVRLHEGTISAAQIKLWALLLIKIANLKDKIETVQNDFKILNLPKPIEEYFNERIAKYSKRTKTTKVS